MSLKVDLRVGETLTFNDGQIVVTLLEKSGQLARISVDADASVHIQPPPPRKQSLGMAADRKCWLARYKPACMPS